MRTHSHAWIIGTIALMVFGAIGGLAQTEPQPAMQHDMSKMDMSGMMNEPHHVLAMAYMHNIGAFTTALHKQAERSVPLDAKFAKAAVAEIKRSHDQMEKHHGEHMKTMSEEMRSHMAPMMKEMDSNRAMLKDAISTLEKDVRTDQLDSKQVAAHSGAVIDMLNKMSKMGDHKSAMKL